MALELDPAAILATCGITDVLAVQRVTGGTDTAIWRVDTIRGPRALRVLRPEQQDVANAECSAMAAAHAQGLPIPAVFAADRWKGHPVIVMDWVVGETIAAWCQEHPEDAERLGYAMGKTQARLHQIALPPDSIADIVRQVQRLMADAPVLREWWRTRAQAPARLLHLDFHPLNIMTDGQDVTGIIDWANVAFGDPRIDVARTASIFALLQGPFGKHFAIAKPMLALMERGWVAGYRDLLGDPGDLTPFMALAFHFMRVDMQAKVSPAEYDWIVAQTTQWETAMGGR